MSRKLASIQKISAVIPIKGADSIELVNILGWQCVAKKGEFKIHDLCVYFEIDSVVPDIPVFEFLRSKKFRVKTARFRGQLSQGLAMPLYHFNKETYIPETVGLDVTNVIGVRKYEQPEVETKEKHGFVIGRSDGMLPDFVSKTDEVRLQSYPELLEEHNLKETEVYITLKMDGTSATFATETTETGRRFIVCSRNRSIQRDPSSIYWKIAEKYKIEEALLSLPFDCYIQGEICGPGIQQNRLGLAETEFYLFNIVAINNSDMEYENFVKWIHSRLGSNAPSVPLDLSWNHSTKYHFGIDLITMFSMFFNIPTVPVLHLGTLNAETVHDYIDMSRGTYPLSRKPREGIVVRLRYPQYSRNIQKPWSFKVINNEFLEINGL